MKKTIVYVVITLLISACSEVVRKSPERKVLVDPVKEDQKTVNQKAKTLTSIELSQNKKLLIKQQISTSKRSKVLINNENFKVSNWPLKKGSKVYNLNMNESGTIKGDFVVVTEDNRKLSVYIEQNYQVKTLAENTYKLTPKLTLSSIEIMDQYKSLQQLFKLVEMSIDYSGQPKVETF